MHLRINCFPVYALASLIAAVTAVDPFFVNFTMSAFFINEINVSAAFNSIKDGLVKLLPLLIAIIAAALISFVA